MKKYFVMLQNQKQDRLVPMVDPNGELYMFDALEDADSAANNTLFGHEFGYRVFDAEDGQ